MVHSPRYFVPANAAVHKSGNIPQHIPFPTGSTTAVTHNGAFFQRRRSTLEKPFSCLKDGEYLRASFTAAGIMLAADTSSNIVWMHLLGTYQSRRILSSSIFLKPILQTIPTETSIGNRTISHINMKLLKERKKCNFDPLRAASPEEPTNNVLPSTNVKMPRSID
jgi:hypothetical protein